VRAGAAISIDVDARYAPDVLILRLTAWPTPAEQTAFLEQMLTLGLRRPVTSAVLDITAVRELPDPDALAEAFARAVGKNAFLSRTACLVQTPEQEQFAATLKQMATRPDDIGVFTAEDAALKWLGVDLARVRP
jgi:hypothetical protein